MKHDLQRKLLDKYPIFFQTEKKIYIGEKPMINEIEELSNQKQMVEPIQFGIQCGDGWYWLLNNLMNSIYNYQKYNKKEFIKVNQIKEKLGGLNFYCEKSDDIVRGMIWLAEHMSYNICEECGTIENVGRTQMPWISVRCKTC